MLAYLGSPLNLHLATLLLSRVLFIVVKLVCYIAAVTSEFFFLPDENAMGTYEIDSMLRRKEREMDKKNLRRPI